MLDLSLPGYKYLGPFNDLNKREPTNWNDFVALLHDIGYSKIIWRGGNPYLNWSDADAQAYEKFDDGDVGGWIGKRYFGLKKQLYEWGLIGNADDPRPEYAQGHDDEEFPPQVNEENLKAWEEKLKRDKPNVIPGDIPPDEPPKKGLRGPKPKDGDGDEVNMEFAVGGDGS